MVPRAAVDLANQKRPINNSVLLFLSETTNQKNTLLTFFYCLQEVDYALYFFELIPDNLKHMEISNPVAVYDYTLIQAWPHEESRLKVIARPFTLTVKDQSI